MRHVLLLEDDASLGATLSERLAKESYQVKWVREIRAGREALKNNRFDLAIFDVGLPDGNAFDLAIEMRATSLTPFIFVTARADAADRLRGYEIGAEEYIPKPFHLKELLLRVRHVLENHAMTPIIEKFGVRIDIEGMSISSAVGTAQEKTERLSLREASLLKLLIDRSPKAVSRDEVLDLIWGKNEYPSNRTVDNVILRLRSLLGQNLGNCIHSIRGFGYAWIHEDSEK